MKRHGIEMCTLADTKKKGKGNLRCGEDILMYNGKNKKERAASEVDLLLHEKYENNIQDIEYISNRILHMTLKLQETTMTHIIRMYIPDITKPQIEEDFYQALQAAIDVIPKRDEIVILGDLNAREQRGHYRNKEPLQ